MNLLEIEKELAGENGKEAMLRYDGMLAELDGRIASALAEGLPPDEYSDAEQLKNAVLLARKLLRLAVANGRQTAQE